MSVTSQGDRFLNGRKWSPGKKAGGSLATWSEDRGGQTELLQLRGVPTAMPEIPADVNAGRGKAFPQVLGVTTRSPTSHYSDRAPPEIDGEISCRPWGMLGSLAGLQAPEADSELKLTLPKCKEAAKSPSMQGLRPPPRTRAWAEASAAASPLAGPPTCAWCQQTMVPLSPPCFLPTRHLKHVHGSGKRLPGTLRGAPRGGTSPGPWHSFPKPASRPCVCAHCPARPPGPANAIQTHCGSCRRR